jgi:hypothetical protein
MPATPTRRTRRPAALAAVLEHVPGDRAPLQVDEDKGVIFGVRVIGQFSPNCHNHPGVTEGTEYTPACQRDAVALYEGSTIFADHPAKGQPANATRSVRDPVGVLRNVRALTEGGEAVTRADLHYLKGSAIAAAVVEDVKRGMGIYGLSHNALPAKASVVNGRYVIERLAEVNSVDLVTKPATNKNLWESVAVSKTFKAVLESWVAKKSAPRKKVARRLLEDDGLPAAAMDAPSEAPADADPDEALWGGFTAAISALLDQYKAGDLDAAAATKAIGKYVKAHAKLTGSAEPAAEEDDEGDKPMDDKDKKKADETAQENRVLKAKNACLEAGVKPSATLLKALTLLESDEERAALIEEAKGHAAAKKPTSGAPAPKAPKLGPDGKPVLEAAAPKSAEDFAKSIRD